MAMLGPVVVIAETSATDLVESLGSAGAFPIVETKFADAAAAVAKIQPAALVIADGAAPPDESQLKALLKSVEARGAPFMPIIARVAASDMSAIPQAFPMGDNSARLDPEEMTRIFEEGRKQIHSANPWRRSPPGLEPEDQPFVRTGSQLTHPGGATQPAKP